MRTRRAGLATGRLDLVTEAFKDLPDHVLEGEWVKPLKAVQIL